VEVPLGPNPDVVHRRVDDEVVLVHLRTNRIYSLNPTGARLWELLSEGYDRRRIKKHLAEEYDVDDAQLEREVDDLFSELLAEELIVRAS
jgi:hypothetical protein